MGRQSEGLETRTEKTCCCTATSCAGGRRISSRRIFGRTAAAGWICCLGESLGCGPAVFLSAGGRDLKEIPPEQLYDQAAFVLQDNNLFDDTMRRSRSPRMPRAATASAAVCPVCAPISSAAARKPRAGSCKRKTQPVFSEFYRKVRAVLYFAEERMKSSSSSSWLSPNTRMPFCSSNSAATPFPSVSVPVNVPS